MLLGILQKAAGCRGSVAITWKDRWKKGQDSYWGKGGYLAALRRALNSICGHGVLTFLFIQPASRICMLVGHLWLKGPDIGGFQLF